MAQGQFTKDEAAFVRSATEEIFAALSKPKQAEFFGHLNDVLLFLAAATSAAPESVPSSRPEPDADDQPHV